MLVLSLSIRMGEASSPIVLALPYPMIDPLLQKLEPPRPQSQAAPAATPARSYKWNSQLDEVPVALSAHWNGLQITARELINLKVGDLLPVDSRNLNQVEVRMSGVPKFTARLGTRGPSWALEFLSSITN
jgi:flagellar motor switch protein FliM